MEANQPKPEPKDYGCLNAYAAYAPAELTDCWLKNHPKEKTQLNANGTYNRYYCPICNHQYTVDSSD